jgi:hypothetical protein
VVLIHDHNEHRKKRRYGKWMKEMGILAPDDRGYVTTVINEIQSYYRLAALVSKQTGTAEE